MIASRFELRRIDDGDHPLPAVAVFGEVDAANVEALEHALDEISQGALILDLSGADYFGSAGFELLDRLIARGSEAVIAPGSALRRPAALMHVPFHDSVPEAAAAAGRRAEAPAGRNGGAASAARHRRSL